MLYDNRMSALTAAPSRMTVAEFLAWAPASPEHWQLVNGDPQAMAPASLVHGALQSELGRLIGNHLAATDSPCRVITAPGVVPRVLSDHNMRVPDLAVTCTPPAAGEYAITDPVLIVEILRPSKQAQTWSNIWAYTSIPSVREILILRTDRIAAALLRRQSDTTWPDRPADIEELTLESIGFTAAVADFYRTTHVRLS